MWKYHNKSFQSCALAVPMGALSRGKDELLRIMLPLNAASSEFISIMEMDASGDQSLMALNRWSASPVS